jgi:Protein of unknown function/Domain of unknown function (DUF1835)
LRQVLRSRGITDRVVSLGEQLDWGWIASEQIDDRLRWFEVNAGLDWDWVAESQSEFLAEVEQDEDQLIWIAPRSAQDQCGLYWFMHQTQLSPRQMVVADYPLKGAWRGEPPQSLGELGPDLMAQLFDNSPRLDWDEPRFPMEKWRILMDDAAVLRIVDNGMLRSAPADNFDDSLIEWCPSKWTKWNRVVGDTMGHSSDRISDLYLRWRLQVLITAGIIECEGELPGWDMPTTQNPAMIRRAS